MGNQNSGGHVVRTGSLENCCRNRLIAFLPILVCNCPLESPEMQNPGRSATWSRCWSVRIGRRDRDLSIKACRDLPVQGRLGHSPAQSNQVIATSLWSIREANQLEIVSAPVFFYSHDTNTKFIWHFKFIFSKIQNKENKYMYTNTSKIEYILYKIYTAVVKSSPICSFCPWWCSEGLMAEPVEKKTNWKFVLLYFFFLSHTILSFMNWKSAATPQWMACGGT